VRNRGSFKWHPDERFLGCLNSLANGIRHFVGFAEPSSDAPFAIANDDDCAEAEATSTSDDLGDSIDLHDSLFEFAPALIVGTAPGATLASIPVHVYLSDQHRDRAQTQAHMY
jgi:hypothetical protein